MKHPIEGLMQTAMENIKEMVDVNTIIGEPVKSPSGHIIIPVSKVGFGFAAGGSEFKEKLCECNTKENEDISQEARASYPFGGGSGGGVSITPVAFIVVGDNESKLLNLEKTSFIYEKIADMVERFTKKSKSNVKNNVKEENIKNVDRMDSNPYNCY